MVSYQFSMKSSGLLNCGLGIVLACCFFACSDDLAPAQDIPVSDALIVDAGTPDALAIEDALVDAEVIPDEGPMRDAAIIPPVPTRIETSLGLDTVEAGQSVRVTCTVYDDSGEIVDGVDTRFEVRPDVEQLDDDGQGTLIRSETAGRYGVTCLADVFGLRDETPSIWTVTPGAPYLTRATVSPEVVSADTEVEVECEALDRFGNDVDFSDALVAISPSGMGTRVDGHMVSSTVAGTYRIVCPYPGATFEAAALMVVPGPADRLIATLDPALPAYDIGMVVSYRAQVVDAFGNRVVAPNLTWSTEPELEGFGRGRYRLTDEGRYTLRVRLDEPTADGEVLEAQTEILVDGVGPVIRCEAPVDGAMLLRGQDITVTGSIADTAGVALLTADGVPVELEDGQFEITIAPERGLNVIELTATDELGQSTSSFCSFFAADHYLAEGAALADAIVLDLGQAAIDNGGAAMPVDCLADLFRLVLQSDALVSTIDQAMRSQNPVLPVECRGQRVCLFGSCACVGIDAGAEYRSLQIRGPQQVGMALFNGGFRITARIEDIRVNVRLIGDVNNTGSIDVSHIDIAANMAVGLGDNGQPEVSVIPGSQRVTVGGLSANFSGFVGGIVELAFGAFENSIRGEFASALESFLVAELDSVLSGALAGLDISAFDLGIDVPGVNGQAARISVETNLSSMNATNERLRMGIATAVRGPVGQAAESAGVPIFGSPVTPDIPWQQSLGSAIHLGLMNQILHQLWRAGQFEFGNILAEEGAENEQGLTLSLLVPPAVEGIPGADQVRLHFGPAVGELDYEELLGQPLRFRLVATLLIGVSLGENGELSFGGDGVEFESLRFVMDDVQLDPQQREALQAEFGQVVASFAEQALNQALPTVPLPDFELPGSLQEYGVPAGTRMGLRDPQMTLTESHLLLEGRLGQ